MYYRMLRRKLNSKDGFNMMIFIVIFVFLSISLYNIQNKEEILLGNSLVSHRRPLEQMDKAPVAETAAKAKKTTTTTTTTTTKKPEPKLKPKPETKTKPEPEPKPKPNPEPKPKPKPEPKPKLKPNGDEYEFRNVCVTSFEAKEIYMKVQVEEEPSLPQIFVITPTYIRPEVIPELTRLGQSLLLVPRLHWIIAEDSYNCSSVISDLLDSLGLPYTYLISPMPKRYALKKGAKPKGVSNRRAALEWIKEHGNDEDVLYFLDDDNTINVKLFDEIRFTKKVSMFPVGFIGGYKVSSPIVKKGKVVGFYDSWKGGRKFAVDMAGFAVNIGFLRKTKASMPFMAGYEEDGFLKSLGITLDDIEPKAEDCKKILVWHTKTAKNKLVSVNVTHHTDDNIIGLMKNLKQMTVIK